MSDTRHPFLVVTAVTDASARPAALTRSHGEALERAIAAVGTRPIAGLDIIELPLSPQVFTAIRVHLGGDDHLVAMYDVFPLSDQLGDEVRRAAGQFLAAEILWTLDAQGLLGGVPLSVKLDLPRGWEKSPADVHAKLMDAGALDLTAEAIETFKAVKSAWDASSAARA